MVTRQEYIDTLEGLSETGDVTEYEIVLSVLFETELNDPHSPLSHLRSEARVSATEAMRKMITVDPNDAKAVMLLQNEVKRMRDIDRWIHDTLVAGIEASASDSSEDTVIQVENEDGIVDVIRSGEGKNYD